MKVLNVIEIVGNSNIKTVSFVISDLIDQDRTELEIVQEAEELFWQIALENGAHIEKKDYYVEEGYYDLSTHDYKLFLSWSE